MKGGRRVKIVSGHSNDQCTIMPHSVIVIFIRDELESLL